MRPIQQFFATCTLAVAIAPFGCPPVVAREPFPHTSADKNVQIITQIVPDRTLPQNSQVTRAQNHLEISGGTTVGANLFHSFQEFSLPAETIATFQNANTIKNIITRVTGDRISVLEGTLQANGSANLIFINPNGITIGSNAQLDIGGSFLGTTARSLEFADGTQFHATNPASPPLLTISTPIGLQVGSNAGDIRVFGPGNNLFFDNSLATVREERPTGFAVSPQATLALIGGNIVLSGGNLTASGGEIELASLGSGRMRWVETRRGWEFQPQNIATWNRILLEKTASLEASGNGGGFVRLQGSHILLRDGSSILADTLGNGSGRGVYLQAQEAVEVVGESPEGFASSVFAAVAPEATGSGGRLQVETQRFVVADLAIIGTDTLGAGDAGTLQVQAQTVETSGRSFWSGSSFRGATGDGGNIVIATDTLTISGGTQILAFTQGRGKAGAIDIRASDTIEVRGADGSFESTIAASVEASATGRGGNVNLETNRLVLANGGRLSTATSSESTQGRGGNITVRATSEIYLNGTSSEGIPAAITTSTVGTGDGGQVRLETPSLVLQNGAQVSSAAFESGDGGDVRVRVGDRLLVSGAVPAREIPEADLDFFRDESQTQFPSGLSTSSEGSGHAGQLRVSAGNIELRSHGEITVSSTGSGNAGSMGIETGEMRLDSGGHLRADSAAGLGNINLQTDNLLLRGNSQISTNATGTEPGGNIAIATRTLASLENSDITANAIAGDGGSIQITTSGMLLSPDSQITASSQFGVDGQVAVNSPEVNPEAGLLQVDNDLNQPKQIVATPCQRIEGNEFVMTGYGGLPPAPQESLNQFSTWMDWRSHQRSPAFGATATVRHGIQEASGWRRHQDGTVELVASGEQKTNWYFSIGCQHPRLKHGGFMPPASGS
jgi:filamentous hemagglutinin family protein